MPATRKAIESELRSLLRPEQFNDYCPNGLQVEGTEQIGKLVSGVTACQELIDRAVATGADMLLVHHGYFWKGEDPTITGIKRSRIQALLAGKLNLFAYHLPLDVHPELGNNAQLGRLLGLRVTGEFAAYQGRNVGLLGEFTEPMTVGALHNLVTDRLNRKPLIIGKESAKLRTAAWCTGAAQGYIGEAIDAGVDVFITGEVSEPTVHIARETGLCFVSAGHHATERYGVQAVGNYLADRFQLQHEFFDIDNPV
ncbi:MAG: Nif3-like dinuclear metal center hexameric protein [Gammaproteobacteria bacterium]|nr:Nif3-like dinuclear metal center hexameric protein [Pseudomonadales bacterium]MCP5345539.1 Nif3-like dinuclear metal center hexameric protein [Pseudomonadales bacterium]